MTPPTKTRPTPWLDLFTAGGDRHVGQTITRLAGLAAAAHLDAAVTPTPTDQPRQADGPASQPVARAARRGSAHTEVRR